uniref:GST N-terminal domain-containing protein n=1 Tax=Steinernema glaseri TaxID=37863 RepID=A0A1I7Z460_9BILA
MTTRLEAQYWNTGKTVSYIEEAFDVHSLPFHRNITDNNKTRPKPKIKYSGAQGMSDEALVHMSYSATPLLKSYTH